MYFITRTNNSLGFALLYPENSHFTRAEYHASGSPCSTPAYRSYPEFNWNLWHKSYEYCCTHCAVVGDLACRNTLMLLLAFHSEYPNNLVQPDCFYSWSINLMLHSMLTFMLRYTGNILMPDGKKQQYLWWRMISVRCLNRMYHVGFGSSHSLINHSGTLFI